jgi:hypothetical protein
MRTARAAPGSGVWIPPSCNQLGLSVTTLGVFLRKHFIADVCSDAQTKGLIGMGWNDLVQPKQSVILDARRGPWVRIPSPPAKSHAATVLDNDRRKRSVALYQFQRRNSASPRPLLTRPTMWRMKRRSPSSFQAARWAESRRATDMRGREDFAWPSPFEAPDQSPVSVLPAPASKPATGSAAEISVPSIKKTRPCEADSRIFNTA